MTILIFTEGTILMHKNAVGQDRATIVQQVIEGDPSVKNYTGYVPVGNAVEKIKKWEDQNAEIIYLTSRKTENQIDAIRSVLQKNHFPDGELAYRKDGEEYKDVAERIIPDVLIEDDCESIGGEKEMTYPHIDPALKGKIKSIAVKEFGGIDHLSDDLNSLIN